MIIHAFSVRDSKADAYAPPFFVPTIGLAVRAFLAAAEDPGHPMSRFPFDFTLHQVGSFDDSSGVFTPLPAPVHVPVRQEETNG